MTEAAGAFGASSQLWTEIIVATYVFALGLSAAAVRLLLNRLTALAKTAAKIEKRSKRRDKRQGDATGAIAQSVRQLSEAQRLADGKQADTHKRVDSLSEVVTALAAEVEVMDRHLQEVRAGIPSAIRQ